MIFGRARLFGKPLFGAPMKYDTKLLKTSCVLYLQTRYVVEYTIKRLDSLNVVFV